MKQESCNNNQTILISMKNINTRSLARQATNLLGTKDIYNGITTKKAGWSEFVTSVSKGTAHRKYTTFENSLFDALSKKLLNVNEVKTFVVTNGIRSEKAFMQQCYKHGIKPGRKITPIIAEHISNGYINEGLNPASIRDDVYSKFNVFIKKATINSFIDKLKNGRYNHKNDLASWVAAGNKDTDFNNACKGHRDDNRKNHNAINIYPTTVEANTRFARLAERIAFEITSKAVIWQAVTETDLRTKNIVALQDQVRTYLNNNPHCYSDEFIARAKSVATLSMV